MIAIKITGIQPTAEDWQEVLDLIPEEQLQARIRDISTPLILTLNISDEMTIAEKEAFIAQVQAMGYEVEEI